MSIAIQEYAASEQDEADQAQRAKADAMARYRQLVLGDEAADADELRGVARVLGLTLEDVRADADAVERLRAAEATLLTDGDVASKDAALAKEINEIKAFVDSLPVARKDEDAALLAKNNAAENKRKALRHRQGEAKSAIDAARASAPRLFGE